MAYTNVNPQRPSEAGVAFTPVAADNVNGVKIPNDGRVILVLDNSGAASTTTVTIATPRTINGLTVQDRVITVASGAVKVAGPFQPETYNQPAGDTDAGCMRITFTGSNADDMNCTPIQV